MIFCSKCGAQLSDDSAFCPTCGAQVTPVADAQPVVAPVETLVEAPVATPVQAETALDPETANYGLGKAITGTVFAVVACLIRFALASIGPLALFLFSFMSIPFFVIGICFGASSIGNYKEARSKFNRNPIATLILGIVALVLAVTCCIAFTVGIVEVFDAISEIF